jgi:hypothetical protein
MLFVNLSKGKY